ncbi:MAG: hypothetical protein ACRC92_20380 [Peptostreptococcaceae bacterium]
MNYDEKKRNFRILTKVVNELLLFSMEKECIWSQFAQKDTNAIFTDCLSRFYTIKTCLDALNKEGKTMNYYIVDGSSNDLMGCIKNDDSSSNYNIFRSKVYKLATDIIEEYSKAFIWGGYIQAYNSDVKKNLSKLGIRSLRNEKTYKTIIREHILKEIFDPSGKLFKETEEIKGINRYVTDFDKNIKSLVSNIVNKETLMEREVLIQRSTDEERSYEHSKEFAKLFEQYNYGQKYPTILNYIGLMMKRHQLEYKYLSRTKHVLYNPPKISFSHSGDIEEFFSTKAKVVTKNHMILPALGNMIENGRNLDCDFCILASNFRGRDMLDAKSKRGITCANINMLEDITKHPFMRSAYVSILPKYTENHEDYDLYIGIENAEKFEKLNIKKYASSIKNFISINGDEDDDVAGLKISVSNLFMTNCDYIQKTLPLFIEPVYQFLYDNKAIFNAMFKAVEEVVYLDEKDAMYDSHKFLFCCKSDRSGSTIPLNKVLNDLKIINQDIYTIMGLDIEETKKDSAEPVVEVEERKEEIIPEEKTESVDPVTRIDEGELELLKIKFEEIIESELRGLYNYDSDKHGKSIPDITDPLIADFFTGTRTLSATIANVLRGEINGNRFTTYNFTGQIVSVDTRYDLTDAGKFIVFLVRFHIRNCDGVVCPEMQYRFFSEVRNLTLVESIHFGIVNLFKRR